MILSEPSRQTRFPWLSRAEKDEPEEDQPEEDEPEEEEEDEEEEEEEEEDDRVYVESDFETEEDEVPFPPFWTMTDEALVDRLQYTRGECAEAQEKSRVSWTFSSWFGEEGPHVG